MQTNIYNDSKNAFLDTVDPKDYIQLDRVSIIFHSLIESVKKPIKLILLYGKPGTGKSIFLSKLHDELSYSEKVFLYKTPILNEDHFFKTLAKDILNLKDIETINFTIFFSMLEETEMEQIPLIILDEAQLYPNSLMEKIRLLSDTRKMKFIITLHKTETEDLIAKEHFKTRIWETIEHKNASKAELKIYIHKKLMKVNSIDTANMFKSKSINLIYKITKGNYRDTNKLLYTLFEIYKWYDANRPAKINKNSISNKFIEMAALHTGLLND